MENFNRQRAAILNGGLQGMGLRPGKNMQMVATEDIGAFAAMAFEKPVDFTGKTLELAGDELTEDQIAVVFTKVIGRPVKLVTPQNNGGAVPNAEMMAMFNFFKRIH